MKRQQRSVGLFPKQWRAIIKAAKAEGITVTEWMRKALVEKSETAK